MYFNTHFVGLPTSTVTDTSQSASTPVGLPSTTVINTSQSLQNDIGKLVQSHDDLNKFSWEHKRHVLTREPDRDTSSYTRTVHVFQIVIHIIVSFNHLG